MRARHFCIGAFACAALAPLCPSPSSTPVGSAAPPQWPTVLEGCPLHRLPLTAREKRFTAAFPGEVARFTDGKREIIARWVTRPTRALHPSAHCFRGSGYRVTPRPLQTTASGATWGCSAAVRGNEKLRVRERLTDAHGNQWTEVSAWYWAAMTGKTEGPWLALTVAESEG